MYNLKVRGDRFMRDGTRKMKISRKIISIVAMV